MEDLVQTENRGASDKTEEGATKTLFRAGVLFCRRGTSTARVADRVAKFEKLARGAAAYHHRFPQDDPVVFLYVNRAQQPAVKYHIGDDGSFLVLEGDVFNLDELASADGGNSGNEAKALFDLYRAEGAAVFTRIDAGASIAIWDSRDERLLILRDRWGVIPSYFQEEGDVLCWASNVPSLLRVVGYQGVNLPALDYFLGTGHCPAPWSLASGISKIPPGHLLTAAQHAAARVERYWRPTGQPKPKLSVEETTERMEFLLKQSLRRRARAGEDVGLMLSAGVDSKLLAAGLRDLGRSFRAFTFQYAGYDGEFNESDEARRTAQHLGVPFEEIVYGPEDIPENLEWMVKSYGEPFGHGLHSSMMGRIQSDGAMALLNGTGPDSWYQHKWERLSVAYSKLPRAVQQLGIQSIPGLVKLSAQTAPGWLKPLYSKAGRLAHGAQIVTWGASRGVSPRFTGIWNPLPYRAPLYRDPDWLVSARADIDSLLAETVKSFTGENERDTIMFLFRQFFSSEGSMYWNHWWGRATGIQVRFPYLDSDLDDFVMQLPREGTDKDDVRRLAGKLLEKDSANFPKIGQTVPIQHWFRNQLKDFLIDQLSPSRIERSGVFNPDTIATMIDEHLRGAADHAFRLWPIITVLEWQDLASSGKWD